MGDLDLDMFLLRSSTLFLLLSDRWRAGLCSLAFLKCCCSLPYRCRISFIRLCLNSFWLIVLGSWVWFWSIFFFATLILERGGWLEPFWEFIIFWFFITCNDLFIWPPSRLDLFTVLMKFDSPFTCWLAEFYILKAACDLTWPSSIASVDGSNSYIKLEVIFGSRIYCEQKAYMF